MRFSKIRVSNVADRAAAQLENSPPQSRAGRTSMGQRRRQNAAWTARSRSRPLPGHAARQVCLGILARFPKMCPWEKGVAEAARCRA